MSKHIPITGIPSHAEYHELEEKSWFKGFVIRNQTTIRFRIHHLELLQNIAKISPLFLGRKIDLSKWEFGHASTFIRAMARVQLREQLIECNAEPAKFTEKIPQNTGEVLMCCFQSAKRCAVDLNLDRLRDTMLDVLIMPREDLAKILKQDADFCKDSERPLESWKTTVDLMGDSDVNRNKLLQ